MIKMLIFCYGDIINIPYKIKFIDSARFIASSLSNFINILTEVTKLNVKIAIVILKTKVSMKIYYNTNIYLVIKNYLHKY